MTCTDCAEKTFIAMKDYKDQRCCGGEIDLKETLWCALLTRESRMCESVALPVGSKSLRGGLMTRML